MFQSTFGAENYLTAVFHSENLVTVFKISKNTPFEPEMSKKWYFCQKGCIQRGTQFAN